MALSEKARMIQMLETAIADASRHMHRSTQMTKENLEDLLSHLKTESVYTRDASWSFCKSVCRRVKDREGETLSPQVMYNLLRDIRTTHQAHYGIRE